MREIKFKFWDKHDKKFVTWPENMYIAGDGKIFTYENIEVDLKEEEIIPVQYTGLKDKNGKEIYEGDIVRLIEELEGGEHNLHQVIFEDSGYFTLKPYVDSGDFIPTLGYFTDQDVNDRYYTVEIIGNIYENSDLLKS